MYDQIVLGIVGIKNCGTYNAQTTYEKLNVVTYQGSTYCALKETKGNLPTNTNYWQLYASKGDIGPVGPVGPIGPIGPAGAPGGSTPLTASNVSGMTDTSKVYVNTTDGKWYYYNGSSWVQGGVYQGTVLNTEDEERIENLESEVYIIEPPLTITGFVDNTGHWNGLSSCSRTDYIPINKYNKIECYNYLSNNGSTLAFYDENKTFLPNISILGDGTAKKQTVNIPLTAKFVVFSNYNSQVANPYIKLYKGNSTKVVQANMLEDIEDLQNDIEDLQDTVQELQVAYSILKNKKIGFLGDSITNGYRATTPFRTLIANATGCNSINYGINQSRISNTGDTSTTNPMCLRYLDMADDLDYICVFGGTNDYAGNVALGTETSTDNTTFYGAVNTLITGLINKYPTKKIIFLTPIIRRLSPSLINYVNVIKERCAYYSVPVLDLYNMSGLNCNIDIVNQTMFGEADGLHPNDLGHKMIANKIKKALESI